MIRSVLYDPSDGRLRDGGAELIDVWEESSAATIWVAIEGEPRESEENLLSSRFGIHPLAVTDALRERHPPQDRGVPKQHLHPLEGSRRALDVPRAGHDPALPVRRGSRPGNAKLGTFRQYREADVGSRVRRPASRHLEAGSRAPSLPDGRRPLPSPAARGRTATGGDGGGDARPAERRLATA